MTDTTGLIAGNVALKTVEYKGRKALLITKDSPEVGFALLPGTDFRDGTIEADLGVNLLTPPGVRMSGFLSIAFGARRDASHYELFYIRPKNSVSDDQGMRNHSVQYTEAPDFGWNKLRREWPSIYEAYAPLQLESWMKIKIEVKGRSPRLYVNGSAEPRSRRFQRRGPPWRRRAVGLSGRGSLFFQRADHPRRGPDPVEPIERTRHVASEIYE